MANPRIATLNRFLLQGHRGLSNWHAARHQSAVAACADSTSWDRARPERIASSEGVYDGKARFYRRHEPKKTVLYQIVSEHLESFLEEVRNHYDQPLPVYVQKELREYLRCGLHPYGFLRALCKDCGRTVLVAFSCQRRSLCCSCSARRMCNSAAYLVDHVLPEVPLRQWVLSVPYELRLLLARRTDALNFVGRTLVKEVFRWQRERARQLGLPDVRSGAIEWPQRFGGSLNLNVHYHLAAPDGVFTRSAADARAEFHRLPPPAQSDLEDIALNVGIRVERWLGRKQLLRDADQALFNNQAPERSPLEGCLEGSLGVGELTCLPEAGRAGSADAFPPLPAPSRAARRGGHHRGFDVHAGVVVSGADREGRERLLRYCARPPLSLERLSVTEDGMVAYRLRKPFSPTQTHRLMTPLQFMGRLAALVAPPRCPLIRFHGVFGPHCAWRRSVVASAPIPAAGCASHDGRRGHEHGQGGGTQDQGNDAPSATAERARWSDPAPDAARKAERHSPSGEKAGSDAAAAVSIVVPASAEQGGSGKRRPWRINWHTLLKRVYCVDSLACSCGGRLKFVSLVTDEKAAKEILESMGLPSEPPPIVRAGGGGVDYDVPLRAKERGPPNLDPNPAPREWD